MKKIITILFILISFTSEAQSWFWGDLVRYHKVSGKKIYDINSSGDTTRIFDPATGKIIVKGKSGAVGIESYQEGNFNNTFIQAAYGNGSSRQPTFQQKQSRGTILNPNSSTLNSDIFGAWIAQGNNGSAFSNGSFFFFQASGDWNSSKNQMSAFRGQIFGRSDNGAGSYDSALRDRIQYDPIGNIWAFIPSGASYNFNGGVGIGRPNNDIDARLDVASGLSSTIVLMLRGASGQTGNLLQCIKQDSTVLMTVDSAGKITAPNILIKGSSTQSGNASATTFNIAHGLGTTPTWWFVTAASADAANISYVTADATNIIVHYTTPPASGTNNLTFKYSAK